MKPEFLEACLFGKNHELTSSPAFYEVRHRAKVIWEFLLRAGVGGHFWYFVTVVAVTMKFAAFENHETLIAQWTKCGAE